MSKGFKVSQLKAMKAKWSKDSHEKEAIVLLHVWILFSALQMKHKPENFTGLQKDAALKVFNYAIFRKVQIAQH